MSISEALVLLGGQLQRAGDTTVQCNRFALGPPVPLAVSGNSFTMTHSVHELSNSGNGTQNVDAIFGGEQGEVLFLFGDGVRLRNRNNGNIRIPSNYRIRNDQTALLYFTGTVWVAMARAR